MTQFEAGKSVGLKGVEPSNVEIATASEILSRIRSLQTSRGVVLVGVDGCGGSGKSTLTRALVGGAAGEAVMVQMDDFYKPSAQRPTGDDKSIGGNFDCDRLRRQVLEPLSRGEEGKYQRYDWNKDSLAEWHTVPSRGIVVIEGVYSTREDLRGFYDFRIFVQCPYEVRLRRGIERDGEASRDTWVNLWMPAEEEYMDLQQPWRHASIKIDGALSPSSDAFYIWKEDQ